MRVAVFLGFFLITGCEAPRATETPEVPPPAPAAPPVVQATEPLPGNADGAIRAKVDQLLGIPGYVADRGALKSLGTGVFEALTAIAEDDASPVEVRARALTSLASLGDPRAAAELRLALRSFKSSLLLRTALFGLARVAGNSAVPDVAAYLRDSNPTVRLAAAEALAHVTGSAARSALRQRLDTETDAAVRDALTRALAR
jgi:HEAT repeat protein